MPPTIPRTPSCYAAARPETDLRSGGCGWLLALLLVGASTQVQAGPSDVRSFDIPAKPLSAALVDFAIQAGVSLGGARSCTGETQPLKGRYGLSEGLGRLLLRSGCSFEWIDAETVRIAPVTRPPIPPRGAPQRPDPPAPPVEPEPQLASEVVVTVTKRPELRDQLPYAFSALGAEQLRAFGADGASDIGQQMAGVTVTNLGPGRDKILLRGLSDGAFTGRTQSTVGIYLDNVPVTYNAPDPDLRLADIEKVEVLRGPQGSLYGSGSIGGIYRIVPRKPELDRYSGYLTVSGAETRGGAPGGAVEAMINAPLLKDRIGFRGVGYHEIDGGYIDDLGQGRDDVNRVVRTGGRVALQVALAGDWTAELGGAIQFINSDATQYATPSVGRYARANRVAEPHDNDFYQAHLTITGQTPFGVLTSSTAVVRHDVDSRYDASTARASFGAPGAAPAPFDDMIEINLLTQEMNLASRGDGRFRWLVGGFASAGAEKTHDLLRTLDAPTPVVAYREDRKDELAELAAFGEASYRLTPRLTLTGGLRYFRTFVRTSSVVALPVLSGERQFLGKHHYSGWAPKFAVQYQLSPGSLAYALVSEGYRAGGFNTEGLLGQTFTAPGEAEPNRTFLPDELWNYEFGLKTKLMDGRLQLRVAAFYDVWTDLQTDQFLPSGLSYTANVGEGRNKGLEAELAYQPVEGLTLQFNALVEGPELTRVAAGSQALRDIGLPGVPDALVGGGFIYRREVRSGIDLTLGGQLQYVGHSRLTFDADLAPVMGGYVAARLAASLESAHWRLAAVLSNPTNAHGDTFAFGNPFTLRSVKQETPLRPATLRVDLTAKF
ncbi:MAG: TonB-dependent receptor [Caulobacteraceae bacterium]